MSLLGKHPKAEVKIKELQTQIYEPHKISTCSEHHLPKDQTCLSKNCLHYMFLICKDCHPSNSNHPLINIHKLVPKMAQFLREEWSLISKDHKTIQNQWKHCLVNVNYCLDILGEIKSQIEQRSQKVLFTVFDDLLEEVYSMFKHAGSNITPQSMLKNFARLNQKYHLVQTEQKSVNCPQAEEERAHNQRQVKKASQQTKSFSESALAFSQQLASILEERFKMQKRVNKLKQLTQNKIFTLKDLLKEHQNLEEVGDVMIEVGKQKKGGEDGVEVEQILGKCQNLKSLRIASKGVFEKGRWRPIMNSMEYLKYLKQLILNIQASDLQPLTQLFKQRNKAIRQVERLTLQITDQKELSVKDVCNFVNTMQLRGLQLTLTRDNLNKEQMSYLLKNLRMCTSMSQLPLNTLILNISKNKVKEGQDLMQISHLFNHQAQKIKEKSITL